MSNMFFTFVSKIKSKIYFMLKMHYKKILSVSDPTGFSYLELFGPIFRMHFSYGGTSFKSISL